MMNRYKKGEVVVVNGKGKVYGEKNVNAIGIIKEKDYYFNQYYVEVIFGKDDWFKEQDLDRVFEKELKKTMKYKICFAVKKEGYEYIRAQMMKNKEQTIDLFKQADLFQEYKADDNMYIFMFWKDTYWPENNYTVQAIEESLPELRKINIPYQYIKMGITDNKEKEIKISEFIKNDSNVNVFEVLTSINIKKIGGIV